MDTLTASQVKGAILMKKLLLVLVSVILLAGAAQAVEPSQAITAEYLAQGKGHTVATDSSVVLKLWSTGGSANPAVGISSSTSIIVYSNILTQAGYTLNTSTTALDTVGEVVDYINTNFSSDSSVRIFASVGQDARRATVTTQLVPANYIGMATNAVDTTALVNAQTNGRISAGVEANSRYINRLKSIVCTAPAGFSTTGADGTTITIYDGNTAVWSKYTTGSALRATTDNNSSASTITFNGSMKGITSTKGNSIMVEAVNDNTSSGMSTQEKTIERVSIVYDQLEQ